MFRARVPSSVFHLAFFLGIFLGVGILSVGGIASEAHALQATARWNANPEPNIAGYKVHYGTSSRNYSQTINVGNKTSCTIPNLEDGKIYYFAATAYDTAGNESAYSAEQVITTPGAQVQYTLTITKTGSGAGDVANIPTGRSFLAGTNVTLTATPDANSTFAGWSGACTGTGACTLVMNSHKSVTAQFNPKAAPQPTTFKITATAGSGGNISPSGTVTINQGASQTFTITANSGYAIEDVKVNGVSQGAVSSFTFSNVGRDHTIVASFKALAQNQYSLSVYKAGTGVGEVGQSPSGNVFGRGTVVTLTATANTGSVFAGWSGACTGSASSCTVTMNANKSVTATFNVVTFKIVATAGVGGSISPSGTVVVNQGDSRAFTIVPNAGYAVSDVKVNGVSHGAIRSFTFSNVGRDHTIAASFNLVSDAQYSLSVYKAGTGTGNVVQDPLGTVFKGGTLVTLRAEAESGSRFSGWLGACSGSELTCQLVMGGSREVTAVFERVESSGLKNRTGQRGVVVDLDGDGKSDVIWFNEETGHVYVWYLDGARFKGVQFVRNVSESKWNMVGGGRLRGQGVVLVYWHNWETGEVYAWDVIRDSFVRDRFIRRVEDTGWRMVGVGDFNGDGKMDILWHHQGTGALYVWFMDGVEFLRDQYIRTVEDVRWQVVGVGDFNRDGKMDILWQHQGTGALYVWFMDGVVLLRDQYILSVEDMSWKVVGVGRFGGLGGSDILWRNERTGEVYVWRMDGAVFLRDERVVPLGSLGGGNRVVFHDLETGGVSLGYLSEQGEMVQGVRLHTVLDFRWKAVGVGSFSGVGGEDILWHHQGTGEVYVWRVRGGKFLGDQRVAVVGDTGWKVVGVGDFNKDGKVDIVWQHEGTGDVYVWYMDGMRFMRDEFVARVGDTRWRVIGVGDLNGDGHPDLLWKHEGTGDVYMWHMNGVRYIHEQGIRRLESPGWQAGGVLQVGDQASIIWRDKAANDLRAWYLRGSKYVRDQRFKVVQVPN